MNKEKIKEEAKEILAKFSKAISKVKLSEKSLKAEVGGFREESNAEGCDKDFRERIFDNAPEADDDCVIAEKKKW